MTEEKKKIDDPKAEEAKKAPSLKDVKKEDEKSPINEEVKNEEVKPEGPKTAIEEALEKQNDIKPKSKKRKLEYETIGKEAVKTGMVIRVHQKIVDTNSKGEEKERIQIFQGMVLAKKHGKETGSTITVRKVSGGIGVEKIFPLNMPTIEKIELARKYKVKQSKPYYLRNFTKRLTEIKE